MQVDSETYMSSFWTHIIGSTLTYMSRLEGLWHRSAVEGSVKNCVQLVQVVEAAIYNEEISGSRKDNQVPQFLTGGKMKFKRGNGKGNAPKKQRWNSGVVSPLRAQIRLKELTQMLAWSCFPSPITEKWRLREGADYPPLSGKFLKRYQRI